MQPLRKRKLRKKKLYKKPKPLEEWLHELALLDKQWRKEGKYGPPIANKVKDLIENKPIVMTDVFITPSMYMMKFGIRKKRRK